MHEAVKISMAVRKAWIDKYGECFQGNCNTIVMTLSKMLAKRKVKHCRHQVLLTLKDGSKGYHWWVVLESGLILDPAAWYAQDEVNTSKVMLNQLGY